MEDHIRYIGFVRTLQTKIAQGMGESMPEVPDRGKENVKKLLLGMAGLPVLALGGRALNRFLGRKFPKTPPGVA